MNDIFAKDLSGEMVSPNEPGYDELITDIFDTMKTATEMNTGYHHRSATTLHRLWKTRNYR